MKRRDLPVRSAVPTAGKTMILSALIGVRSGAALELELISDRDLLRLQGVRAGGLTTVKVTLRLLEQRPPDRLRRPSTNAGGAGQFWM